MLLTLAVTKTSWGTFLPRPSGFSVMCTQCGAAERQIHLLSLLGEQSSCCAAPCPTVRRDSHALSHSGSKEWLHRNDGWSKHVLEQIIHTCSALEQINMTSEIAQGGNPSEEEQLSLTQGLLGLQSRYPESCGLPRTLLRGMPLPCSLHGLRPCGY